MPRWTSKLPFDRNKPADLTNKTMKTWRVIILVLHLFYSSKYKFIEASGYSAKGKSIKTPRDSSNDDPYLVIAKFMKRWWREERSTTQNRENIISNENIAEKLSKYTLKDIHDTILQIASSQAALKSMDGITHSFKSYALNQRHCLSLFLYVAYSPIIKRVFLVHPCGAELRSLSALIARSPLRKFFVVLGCEKKQQNCMSMCKQWSAASKLLR